VGQFLAQRSEKSTLLLGKKGEAKIEIGVKYVDDGSYPTYPGDNYGEQKKKKKWFGRK